MTRILLVDDNEMNLDMLSRRLERKGFQVLPVADGRAALEVARQQALDLILLDMSLPEMSGCEVASALKSHRRTALIPIIALTAHASESDRQRALAAGCDDFDTKPVELERLLSKIGAFPSIAGSRQQQ